MESNFEACLMFAGMFFVGIGGLAIACGILEILYDIWEKHTKHKPVYFPNWEDEDGLD